MALPVEPLGIDNVIFEVEDLDPAVAFYLRCGLNLRWRSDEKAIALFSIGRETPGLLVRKASGFVGAGCLWVEVADADRIAAALAADGLQTTRIETATGVTIETRDPSGNRIGFADYARRPELGRQAPRD